MDGALIIDGNLGSWKVSVNTGAWGDGEAFAFGDGACRTVKVLSTRLMVLKVSRG